MKISRPAQFMLFLLMVLPVGNHVFAADTSLPLPDSMKDVAQRSIERGIPIVVFISRAACPYCRTLRKTILGPMVAANKFDRRAMVVEVSLDRIGAMTGFDGGQTTARAFGETYQAQITPTLLFLDSEGREISQRRVGIPNLEFYTHYLNESINEALLVVQGRSDKRLQAR